MNRANSFTSNALYHLKKWHGRDIDLYVRGAVSQSTSTGIISYPETKYKIKRAPVLEIATAFAEIKAQNFAVAGRPFEFGGNYTLKDTVVIISNKNLPTNYNVNKVDNFIINHRRYSIKDTKEFQYDRLTVFLLEELVGQKANEIHDITEYLIVGEGVIREP